VRRRTADTALGAVAVELLIGAVHVAAATRGTPATARTTRVQAKPHQCCRCRTNGFITPIPSRGRNPRIFPAGSTNDQRRNLKKGVA
jgi:hypothetical protein